MNRTLNFFLILVAFYATSLFSVEAPYEAIQSQAERKSLVAQASSPITGPLSFAAKIEELTKVPKAVAHIIVAYIWDHGYIEKTMTKLPSVSVHTIGMSCLENTYCAAFTHSLSFSCEEVHKKKVAQLRLFDLAWSTHSFIEYDGRFVLSQNSSKEGIISSLNASTLAATLIIRTQEPIFALGSCGSKLLCSQGDTFIMEIDQRSAHLVRLGQQRSEEVPKEGTLLEMESVRGFISITQDEFISYSPKALYHWHIAPGGLRLLKRTQITDYRPTPGVHCVLSDNTILFSALPAQSRSPQPHRPHILCYNRKTQSLKPTDDEFAFGAIERDSISDGYTILGTNATNRNEFALLYNPIGSLYFQGFMKIYDIRKATQPVQPPRSAPKPKRSDQQKQLYYNLFLE